MNRDKLEQNAMRELQRGNTEKALKAYLDVLRQDPKDRRIRQKVADLYLTMGRIPEAVRHFTDVARSLKGSGQERAAISVYKQLINLKPDDTDAREELCECLETTGRKQEARNMWEEAFHIVERREPKKAIKYARRVSRLAPGDVPLKVRVAELLESSRQTDDAFAAWVALGKEARRFGRADDQARFLERALKLRPGDHDTLLSAAEARIVQGEVRVALAHLQEAYGQDPRNTRLLTLLGRALQGLGQLEKARKVWLQAARRHAEAGDRDLQVDALRHALECGEDDPGLRSELERADNEARRHRMRLHDRNWARPVNEAEVRVVVRASTLSTYGFAARAREVLEAADDSVKQGVSWKVHYAELLLAMGEKAAAVDILQAVSPPSTSAGLEIADRLEILGVVPELPSDETEEAILDEDTHGAISTSAHAFKDEPTHLSVPGDRPAGSQDEEEGDRLAELGDVNGAIEAYRRALGNDPSNTELLMKIGQVMSTRNDTAASAPPPVRDQGISLDLPEPGGVDFGAAFGDVDPDALSEQGDIIAEARAMVVIGNYEQALDLLRGQDDIEAMVVSALADRGLGRSEGVLTRLEKAVQLGSEHHPAYLEALWELAGVYLLRKRIGNAERLLDEAALLDPQHRPVEMAARRRGIELLRQR